MENNKPSLSKFFLLIYMYSFFIQDFAYGHDIFKRDRFILSLSLHVVPPSQLQPQPQPQLQLQPSAEDFFVGVENFFPNSIAPPEDPTAQPDEDFFAGVEDEITNLIAVLEVPPPAPTE